MIAHFSLASCVLAQHIVNLMQENDIPYTYNETEDSVTVDLQDDDDSLLSLKVLISSIDIMKLADSNFWNMLDSYTKHMFYIRKTLWCNLDNGIKTLYLELDFKAVDTTRWHAQPYIPYKLKKKELT